MHRKIVSIFRSILFGIIITIMLGAGVAQSKPLFVISDFGASPMPIRAFEIVNPITLSLQSEPTETSYGSGGAYMAIDSTVLNNARIFVTYHGSDTIQVLDANNLSSLGTVSVPGASSLAGIAFDMDKQRVYAVDKNTNHLYVYDWTSTTNTLTLVPGPTFNYFELSGVTSAQGIAYDSGNSRDILYVADNSNIIPYFDTTSFVNQGAVTLNSHEAVGIVVNQNLNVVYTSGGSNHDFIIKHDVVSGTEITVDLERSVIDVAVDEDSGFVYATTRGHGSAGNSVVTLFSSLRFLRDLAISGEPTGLTIPLDEINYNPLNLTKTGPSTINNVVGDIISYEICYDNRDNAFTAENVLLTDTLPSELAFYDATSPCIETVTGSGVVTCDLGDLPAFAPQACITLEAEILSLSCNIRNSASITSTTSSIGPASVVSRGLNEVTITTHSLPSASVNQDYSFPFTANGGTGSYRWEIYQKTPSPGLTSIFTASEILDMLNNLTIDPVTGVLTWISLPQIPESDELYIDFAIAVWDGCENLDTVAFQYTDPEVGGGEFSVGSGSGGGGGGGGCFISTAANSGRLLSFELMKAAFLVLCLAGIPAIYRRVRNTR